MDTPKIWLQLNELKKALRRILHNTANTEYYGVICLGPQGCGKTVTVEQIAEECHVQLIRLPADTTLVGFLTLLRRNPRGTIWLDDNGKWAFDLVFLDVLKSALQTSGPRWIGSVNHNTLRDGIEPFLFSGRIIITSNIRSRDIPPRLMPHVEALADRTYRRDISSDPSERLRYIDYLVAERDYFRSPEYLRDQKMAHRQLNKEQIVEILFFMHENAYRVDPSLRTLNSVARACVTEPDHWYLNLLINAPDPVPWPRQVPPMPEILNASERNGTATNLPRGKKARRRALMDIKWAAKRAAVDAEIEKSGDQILECAGVSPVAPPTQNVPGPSEAVVPQSTFRNQE
jgi:hypothetical protein